MDEPSDTEPSAPGDWRKAGRCSACALFVADYGDPPEIYGHCKMYLRSGQRSADAWACEEFAPLPGFDSLTGSTKGIKNLPPKYGGDPGAAAARAAGRSGSLAVRSRPRKRHIPTSTVVRRRTDGDEAGQTIHTTRTIRSTAMSSEVIATFTEGADMDSETLRDVLLDVIENFIGVEDVELGSKWVGGTLTLQPEDSELQPYVLPIESFFHKIVMLRDRLRVLEQKINANAKLTDSDKVEMQQYISRIYGSLTSFNGLFRERADKFSSK